MQQFGFEVIVVIVISWVVQQTPGKIPQLVSSTVRFSTKHPFRKSVSQGFWSTNLQSFKSWKRRPLIAVASDAIDLFPFPCLTLVGLKAGFRRDGWKRCERKMSHKCPCIAYEKNMEIVGNFDDFHGRYWRRFEGKKMGPRPGDSVLLKTNVGRIGGSPPFVQMGKHKCGCYYKWWKKSCTSWGWQFIPLCYDVKKESRYIVQAGLQKNISDLPLCKVCKQHVFFWNVFNVNPRCFSRGRSIIHFWAIKSTPVLRDFPCESAFFWVGNIMTCYIGNKLAMNPSWWMFFRDTLLGKSTYPLPAGTFESMIFLFVRWGTGTVDGSEISPKNHLGCVSHSITGWWFQIFFIFIPTWGRFPIWLIFFKGVETTN